MPGFFARAGLAMPDSRLVVAEARALGVLFKQAERRLRSRRG